MADFCLLSTECKSPQYHLVFNGLFETVLSTGNDALLDDICNCLFDSDCDIYFYDDKFISDNPLVYHLPPFDEVWLYACCLELEKCCCLSEDCEQVKWIDAAPDETSDPLPNLIEQSSSDGETSDYLPPVFVPVGGKGAAQPNEDDVSIVPITPPEGALPNITYVELDNNPVAYGSASVADFYNPDEPDPENLHQSKQIRECKSCTFGCKQIPICAVKLFCKTLKRKQC